MKSLEDYSKELQGQFELKSSLWRRFKADSGLAKVEQSVQEEQLQVVVQRVKRDAIDFHRFRMKSIFKLLFLHTRRRARFMVYFAF